MLGVDGGADDLLAAAVGLGDRVEAAILELVDDVEALAEAGQDPRPPPRAGAPRRGGKLGALGRVERDAGRAGMECATAPLRDLGQLDVGVIASGPRTTACQTLTGQARNRACGPRPAVMKEAPRVVDGVAPHAPAHRPRQPDEPRSPSVERHADRARQVRGRRAAPIDVAVPRLPVPGSPATTAVRAGTLIVGMSFARSRARAAVPVAPDALVQRHVVHVTAEREASDEERAPALGCRPGDPLSDRDDQDRLPTEFTNRTVWFCSRPG